MLDPVDALFVINALPSNNAIAAPLSSGVSSPLTGIEEDASAGENVYFDSQSRQSPPTVDAALRWEAVPASAWWRDQISVAEQERNDQEWRDQRIDHVFAEVAPSRGP